MKDYPEYRATPDQADALLASQRLGRLIAIGNDGWPQVGLHPYTWDDGVLEVHLVHTDEQLLSLRHHDKALFEVDQVLSAAPSHWVDEEDATHADHFYRCVVVRGRLTLSNDIAAVESHLKRLLARYQPDGRYAAIDRRDMRYRKYMGALTLVRLEGAEVRTKFKLAQRTSGEIRDAIVRGLRTRGEGPDGLTLDLLEEYRPRSR